VIPLSPRNPAHISLNPHTMETLSNVTVRSVTVTTRNLAITYSKWVHETKPSGLVALDSNLDNLTTVDSKGDIAQFDLSGITRIRQTYREVRSHMGRNDVRIKGRILSKYGQREQERVSNILHRTSKRIVKEAKRKNFGIVLEDLTSVRRNYRKGNGQSRTLRGRLNSWSLRELQRRIEYKARWEGIEVIYVNPAGTSTTCSKCGHKMKPEENRRLRCDACGLNVDRDINAARNILSRGMRFVPDAPAFEAMVAVSTARA